MREHLCWMGYKLIESEVPDGFDDPDVALCSFRAQEMLDAAKPMEDSLGGDSSKLH